MESLTCCSMARFPVLQTAVDSMLAHMNAKQNFTIMSNASLDVGASHGVSQGVKQFSEEIEDIITLYHFARQTNCNCFLFFGDPKLKWGISFRVQWVQTFNASSHGVGARLLRNPRWRLAVMASRAL